MEANARINISYDGELKIGDINERDKGLYRCEASNDLESTLTAEMRLMVYGKAVSVNGNNTCFTYLQKQNSAKRRPIITILRCLRYNVGNFRV